MQLGAQCPHLVLCSLRLCSTCMCIPRRMQRSLFIMHPFYMQGFARRFATQHRTEIPIALGAAWKLVSDGDASMRHLADPLERIDKGRLEEPVFASSAASSPLFFLHVSYYDAAAPFLSWLIG